MGDIGEAGELGALGAPCDGVRRASGDAGDVGVSSSSQGCRGIGTPLARLLE